MSDEVSLLDAVRALATKYDGAAHRHERWYGEFIAADIRDTLAAAAVREPEPWSHAYGVAHGSNPLESRCDHGNGRCIYQPPSDPRTGEHDWDFLHPASTCRHCGSEYDTARWVNCPAPAVVPDRVT